MDSFKLKQIAKRAVRSYKASVKLPPTVNPEIANMSADDLDIIIDSLEQWKDDYEATLDMCYDIIDNDDEYPTASDKLSALDNILSEGLHNDWQLCFDSIGPNILNRLGGGKDVYDIDKRIETAVNKETSPKLRARDPLASNQSVVSAIEAVINDLNKLSGRASSEVSGPPQIDPRLYTKFVNSVLSGLRDAKTEYGSIMQEVRALESQAVGDELVYWNEIGKQTPLTQRAVRLDNEANDIAMDILFDVSKNFQAIDKFYKKNASQVRRPQWAHPVSSYYNTLINPGRPHTEDIGGSLRIAVEVLQSVTDDLEASGVSVTIF